jgi:hypothetical protein
MRTRMILVGLIALASSAVFGCSAAKSSAGGANEPATKTTVKGIPTDTLCRMTEDPVFVERSRRDDDCDADLYFGAKNTAAYGDKSSPGFNFQSAGKDGMVYHVLLTMSPRTDAPALQFFATEAGTVSRLIDGRPLPKEIEASVADPSDSAFEKTVTTEHAEFKFQVLSQGTRMLEINVLQ